MVPKTYRIKTRMSTHRTIKKLIYRETKHSNKTITITVAITVTLFPACKQTNKQIANEL